MRIFSSLKNQVAQMSSRFILGLFLGFIALAASLALGVVSFRSQAAANQNPRYGVWMKNLAGGDYVQELNGLQVGDKVRVQLLVINDRENNTIDNLQFYAAPAHNGIYSWIQADSLGKYGVSHAKYSIPDNARMKYIPSTTELATKVRDGQLQNDWIFTSFADNSSNESRLFANSSDRNTGFHLQNLASGPNFSYLVYFDLEVVANNTPIFNNHPEDQPTFQVRKVGESQWRTSLNGLTANDELEFKVYAHNTQRGTIAFGTKAGVSNWTSAENRNLTLTGFVDADNANRAQSNVSLSSAANFSLEYINGSTRFQGRPTLDVQPFDPNATQADGIVSASGLTIGTLGQQEGCWDFLMTITFRARIKQTIPTPSPTPTPTPIVTPSPTPSPTPTPVVTPSPTPTPTPVVTPSPTPSPTPTPTPTPGPQCNSSCSNNSQCPSSMICSNGQCRNPQCVNESSCGCGQREHTGFAVEKYEDIDGDGSRDSNEKGLDWQFEWDKNHDENWRSYETYASSNGRGGTVGDLKENDVIRIREKNKDGWKHTTSAEVTLTMRKNEIQIAIFGNQRIKPTPVTPGETPKELPRTGFDPGAGLGLSASLTLIGVGLKVMSIRLRA